MKRINWLFLLLVLIGFVIGGLMVHALKEPY